MLRINRKNLWHDRDSNPEPTAWERCCPNHTAVIYFWIKRVGSFGQIEKMTLLNDFSCILHILRKIIKVEFSLACSCCRNIWSLIFLSFIRLNFTRIYLSNVFHLIVRDCWRWFTARKFLDVSRIIGLKNKSSTNLSDLFSREFSTTAMSNSQTSWAFEGRLQRSFFSGNFSSFRFVAKTSVLPRRGQIAIFFVLLRTLYVIRCFSKICSRFPFSKMQYPTFYSKPVGNASCAYVLRDLVKGLCPYIGVLFLIFTDFVTV